MFQSPEERAGDEIQTKQQELAGKISLLKDKEIKIRIGASTFVMGMQEVE